jgi:hypothetical protein
MSPKNAGHMPVKTVDLHYDSIRNISAPEDRAQSRRVYSGHIPATEVLGLPTDENVRDYLVEAEGKQRRILTTLKNDPMNFSVLNGGVVIVARDCEVDDQAKIVRLLNPSIINGSQTQGVLRDFLGSPEAVRDGVTDIHVTFELIVTNDDSLIADISIARNFQNDVLTISIAGRKGQLDELAEVMEKATGGRLRKKETEYAGDFIDTEKLIQVLAALTPGELSPNRTEKAYAYNQKTKCLKDFQSTYVAAKDPADPRHAEATALYRFYLEIAPDAWALYEKWAAHPGFKGTGLRAIERDEKRNILEVPDGIIFPIIAAMGEFCTSKTGRWTISPPPKFDDDELVRVAKRAYQEIAEAKPHLMGKSRACYSTLREITQLYRKLAA